MSEIRQNCVKNTPNTFGGEHLLDDRTLQSRRAILNFFNLWALRGDTEIVYVPNVYVPFLPLKWF